MLVYTLIKSHDLPPPPLPVSMTTKDDQKPKTQSSPPSHHPSPQRYHPLTIVATSNILTPPILCEAGRKQPHVPVT